MPSRTKPNVIVSVRNVPTVMGVGFLAARLAAKAMGAMIGTKRLISMTKPVTMSQRTAVGGRRRGVVVGLVESPGVSQALKAGAVVGRGRSELVEDLGEAVCRRIVLRLDAPVRGREEARGS